MPHTDEFISSLAANNDRNCVSVTVEDFVFVDVTTMLPPQVNKSYFVLDDNMIADAVQSNDQLDRSPRDSLEEQHLPTSSPSTIDRSQLRGIFPKTVQFRTTMPDTDNYTYNISHDNNRSVRHHCNIYIYM
jgi:hypothetical protein